MKGIDGICRIVLIIIIFTLFYLLEYESNVKLGGGAKINYEYTDLSSVFEPVMDTLEDKEVGVFGPTSLQEYLSNHGFPKLIAPSVISIDSFERLHTTFKKNNAMLFRLGRSTGTGTQFAVAKVTGSLNDFFIFEDDIFDSRGVIYQPKVHENQLFAYKILPKLTENSLINLGFSTGLISFALGLDKVDPIFPPATCSSTFSFQFIPHTRISNLFNHKNGQVEIDSMFMDNRNGIRTLFVIEAKYGHENKSLAKHKLLYPILSIAPYVPKDIPIVPVYIKACKTVLGVHFHIVECYFPDPRIDVRAYNELRVSKYTHLVLPANIFVDGNAD
jgi:hypothetical protein